MGELIGGFGPLRERFGVDADFEVFAEDGDVFAKIEAGAEFGDGCVALGELRDGRWGEEPGGEGVFSHAGAGEGEEFEEAGLSEEVEVGGVEAGMNVDARAGLGPVPGTSDLRCGRGLCDRSRRHVRRMRAWRSTFAWRMAIARNSTRARSSHHGEKASR